ncbi:CotH kinase family protein [Paenibacillus cremeus]|uniref:Spore coat protein CotH n=1 Tax=Paenibacillus cremeus TaxID=2163881 RepID=A0A559KIH9_9BACL|nr:CotH kinase family protein [Paenibacillus cremeus]TVY11944.1 spore coat protein CotH [Paenibacillus cremeus]
MAAEVLERSISIHNEQLRMLQQDVWSERYVPAVMTVNGRKYDIQLRYRGGHTREYPKRSYEVIRGGRTYHYNAEFDDPSLIRNALSFRFFEWLKVPAPKTKHCLLYLNGRNLGVYLELEGVDRTFFRRRGIRMQALFYGVNDNANFSLLAPESNQPKASLMAGYQHMVGTADDRRKLVRFIRRLNTGSSKDRMLALYLRRRLDIDNYLRWLAGAVFTGNYDGFEQNYALYRHRPSQKYRIIPWDYEGTWGRNCFGKPCGSDLVSVKGYNELTRRLLRSPAVMEQYKELLETTLENHFTVRKIIPVAEALHSAIRPHVARDTERKWSFSTFDDEVDFIEQYVKERRRLIADAIRRL